VADHEALAEAASNGPVVGLYVVDPTFQRSGAPRRRFLADALANLSSATSDALVVVSGNPTELVPSVAATVGAARVLVTRDYSPYGRRRDAAVAAALHERGITLHGVGSNYAVLPGSVNKGDGTAYKVFTPFSRAWRAFGWNAPLGSIDVRWLHTSLPGWSAETAQALGGALPQVPWLPSAGEAAAHQRWDEFAASSMQQYADRRDQPAVDGTSRLSAALRWGHVHPLRLLAETGSDRGSEVFSSEICWREFYADVLYREPASAWQNLNQQMNAMPIDTDAAALQRFQRWATGTTGFPIVDAGMRQLLSTGWMHNRVRMIVASFLVKDLHLPWQWGARHFMQHLLDGDLASNSHGWQWTAGTGTDAAPYFRVFNPTSQGQRFDPEGQYVRRWVGELAHIDGAAVHTPAPLLAPDYPAAMVDHAVERDDALARYRSIRQRA
jgi:deoxyribodipyrimidine photo-lyase